MSADSREFDQWLAESESRRQREADAYRYVFHALLGRLAYEGRSVDPDELIAWMRRTFEDERQGG